MYNLQGWRKRKSYDPKNSKSPEDAHTPQGPTTTTQERRNETTNPHQINHTQSGTTTRRTRPQHQKHNEHILATRVWDTFSIQPRGRAAPIDRPTAEIGRSTRPATNHVSYIRTNPLLYYSITSKGGHTAKLKTNQYDAFARVY